MEIFFLRSVYEMVSIEPRDEFLQTRTVLKTAADKERKRVT